MLNFLSLFGREEKKGAGLRKLQMSYLYFTKYSWYYSCEINYIIELSSFKTTEINCMGLITSYIYDHPCESEAEKTEWDRALCFCFRTSTHPSRFPRLPSSNVDLAQFWPRFLSPSHLITSHSGMSLTLSAFQIKLSGVLNLWQLETHWEHVFWWHNWGIVSDHKSTTPKHT